MDDIERAALLERIDATSQELADLIVKAQALNVRARVPLRAPVLEGLQKQISLAKRILAGELVDRRNPENQRPGRAMD